MRGSLSEHWCFTLNNYTRLLDPELWVDCTYCIYQEEVGAAGTAHLQGYIQFSSRKRLSALKKLVGLEEAHLEVMKGSQEQAIAYCSKPSEPEQEAWRIGGPYTFGQPISPQQGKRTDIATFKASLDSNRSLVNLLDSDFQHMLKFSKFAVEYRRLKTPERNHMMNVFVFVGAPGTGKTRTAWTLARMLGTVYNVPHAKGSGLYWDGYDGQTSIILDEFSGNRMSPPFFNSLCDRYPHCVPIHGGAGHQFVSKNIFVLTNKLPRDWWPKSNNPVIGAIHRRLTWVLKFFKSPPPPPGSVAPRPAGVSCLLNGHPHVVGVPDE